MSNTYTLDYNMGSFILFHHQTRDEITISDHQARTSIQYMVGVKLTSAARFVLSIKER